MGIYKNWIAPICDFFFSVFYIDYSCFFARGNAPNWYEQGRIQGGGSVGGASPLDALNFARKVEKGRKYLQHTGSPPPEPIPEYASGVELS